MTNLRRQSYDLNESESNPKKYYIYDNKSKKYIIGPTPTENYKSPGINRWKNKYSEGEILEISDRRSPKYNRNTPDKTKSIIPDSNNRYKIPPPDTKKKPVIYQRWGNQYGDGIKKMEVSTRGVTSPGVYVRWKNQHGEGLKPMSYNKKNKKYVLPPKNRSSPQNVKPSSPKNKPSSPKNILSPRINASTSPSNRNKKNNYIKYLDLSHGAESPKNIKIEINY